ncbi:glutamate receptor ionotropic, kainate 3, partial [Eurytemora carolleeae]|uniref:glutamate receptor ionotropic, kainate 3 n=1 Tax=Eurytemora carolleeae TaxID=1294199 RepID=UPI000C786EEC
MKKKDLINLSFLLQFVKVSFQFSNTRFRVGVVISQENWNSTVPRAVAISAEIINKAENLLEDSSIEVFPIYSDKNSFKLIRAVCKGIKSGFQAVIGPSDHLSSIHVQSICSGLDIPFLDTQSGNLQSSSNLFLKIHPQFKHINKAVHDFVLNANWTHAVILYDSNIPAVLDLQNQLTDSELNILSYKIDGDDFSALLHSVRRNNMVNFLIGFSPTIIPQFFKQCRGRGLIAEGAQFMLMNTDILMSQFSEKDLESFNSFSFYQVLNPTNSLQQELGR